MEARAQVTHVRMSPRKVKVVLDLIRNKPVEIATAIVKNTPTAACEPVGKLLASAVANAENNYNMDKSNLYVAECFACPGPILKRIRPRAQGRAYRINKRTSHITLVLKEKEYARRTFYVTESQSPRPARRRDQRLGFPLVRQEESDRRHHRRGL